MPKTPSDESAWKTLARGWESIGRAFLTLAEGVSKSPPGYRIAGLCIVSLIFIFAFVSATNQSLEIVLLAVSFAIMIIIILAMCFYDSHKDEKSRTDSLKKIEEKTTKYGEKNNEV
ncbi:MAG: hypothetical protein NWE93_08520 [Candidatus Bathyarchaeota archaeon]|nr:hypothetical protein [Candidatus Bathyarchaeota archaeon]